MLSSGVVSWNCVILMKDFVILSDAVYTYCERGSAKDFAKERGSA